MSKIILYTFYLYFQEIVRRKTYYYCSSGCILCLDYTFIRIMLYIHKTRTLRYKISLKTLIIQDLGKIAFIILEPNFNIPTSCWRPAVLHAQIYSNCIHTASPCSKYVVMKQVFPIWNILVITKITTPAYRIYVRYYYLLIYLSVNHEYLKLLLGQYLITLMLITLNIRTLSALGGDSYHKECR